MTKSVAQLYLKTQAESIVEEVFPGVPRVYAKAAKSLLTVLCAEGSSLILSLGRALLKDTSASLKSCQECIPVLLKNPG